jgi:hypothetical protein
MHHQPRDITKGCGNKNDCLEPQAMQAFEGLPKGEGVVLFYQDFMLRLGHSA